MNALWKSSGHRAELGEGPVWDPETQELVTVDIFGKKVFRWQVVGESLARARVIPTDTYVGAAVPLSTGQLITCEANGLFLRDSAGVIVKEFPVPELKASKRINDAKLSPSGTIWFGVMHVDAVEAEGSLCQMDNHGTTTTLLEGLTIPNGMDWWGDQFWFVDGPRQEVACYRLENGQPSEVIRTVPTPGIPDGLTIDRHGRIWVALWGEGKVVCLSQNGELITSIEVPAPHVTSVCFFGKELEHLAITSARFGLWEESFENFPDSGELFVKWNAGEGRLPHLFFG